MICPKCGEKSSVFTEGWGVVTCLGHCPYWDENGVYHSHDPNVRTQGYMCSKNHRWEEKSSNPCWCGWSGGERTVRILEDAVVPETSISLKLSGEGSVVISNASTLSISTPLYVRGTCPVRDFFHDIKSYFKK